jgi:transposase
VARNRTIIAQAFGIAKGWPPAGVRSGVPDRSGVCSQEWLALESAASGDGLRQRRHLLAAIARLDATRSLARGPSSAVASSGKTRFAPTFPGHYRQRIDARGLGGQHTGPNPTDRAKKGCKRHVITDARGVPLVVDTGPANEPDGKLALAMLDRLPAVVGRRGRPRRKPKIFQGDAAYGTAAIIRQVAQRGIRPLLAPYGNTKREHGSGLGRTRYVVERTLSWFSNFRRIKLCYERTAEHLQAFHELAAAIICLNKLIPNRKRVLK